MAVKSFKDSAVLRMKIIRSYPDSPFHETVAADLAETEFLLGEAYFQSQNYRAAWQALRRSLMRDFPDNAGHKLKVNLSLARNYQFAGDLKSASDIYARILSKSDSLEAKKTARNFFLVFEKKLKKLKIDLDGLIVNKPGSSRAKKTARKPVPAGKKEYRGLRKPDGGRLLWLPRQERSGNQFTAGLEGFAGFPRNPGGEGSGQKIERDHDLFS